MFQKCTTVDLYSTYDISSIQAPANTTAELGW